MVLIIYNKDILRHLFYFLQREITIISKVCKFWRAVTIEFYNWSLVYSYSAKIPIDKVEFSETFIRRLFDLCNSCPTLWRFEEEALSVRFEINVLRLEELLLAQEEVKGLDELVQLLTAINTKAVHISLFGTPQFLPSRLGILMPPKPPKRVLKARGLKQGAFLYPHQLDALAWMVHRETSSSEPIIYSPVYSLRSSKFISNFEPACWVSPGSPELRADQTCNGGILADEEGLGKSATVIALIVNNPPAPLPYPLMSPSAYTLKSLLFPSRATLIFCPLLHVEYWRNQIAQFIPANSLKVICLSVYEDIKTVTYRNIVHADVVVVSYSFFLDYNYFFIGNFAVTNYAENLSASLTLNSPPDELISEWITKSLMLLKYENHHGLDHTAPVLEYFSYHRVVVTDGQERLTNPFFRNIFKWIDSKHRWIVSENPFPNFGALWGLSEFFSLNFHDSCNSILLDFIATKLTWRNTKQSVKLPDHSPKFSSEEELVLLEYTDIENAAHSDTKSSSLDTRLEGCCYVAPSSLSRLRFDKLSAAKGEVQTTSAELTELNEKLTDSRQKLEIAKLEGKTVPTGLTRQKSTRRIESRNIYFYLTKQQRLKDKVVAAIETFALYYATQSYTGPWFDVHSIFEPINDDTINAVALYTLLLSFVHFSLLYLSSPSSSFCFNYLFQLQQALSLEEYIQRRRKEREDRKEFISSIKPEMAIESKNLEKHKASEPPLPHEVDEKKLKEKEEAETLSMEDMQETVDFITKFIPEKPNKSIIKEPYVSKENSPTMSKKKTKGAEEELEDQILGYLVNHFGTKTGNMIYRIRQIWNRDPLAKILIFSSYDAYLNFISTALAKCGITCAFLRAAKKIKHYMPWGKERVMLMNFKTTLWQAKTIEVSHVFLMNPVNVIPAKDAIAMEERAIKIAVPQKGRKQIYFLRFIINRSLEHEIYQVQSRRRILPPSPAAPARSASLSSPPAVQTNFASFATFSKLKASQ